MAQVINTNSLSLLTQNNLNKSQVFPELRYRASVFWSAYQQRER